MPYLQTVEPAMNLIPGYPTNNTAAILIVPLLVFRHPAAMQQRVDVVHQLPDLFLNCWHGEIPANTVLESVPVRIAEDSYVITISNLAESDVEQAQHFLANAFIGLQISPCQLLIRGGNPPRPFQAARL